MKRAAARLCEGFTQRICSVSQECLTKLADAVPRVVCPSHPQVLMKMLSLAVERLETNRYMTSDEKYRNVRVVPHLLW